MTDRFKEALEALAEIEGCLSKSQRKSIGERFNTIRASLTAAGGWQDISSAPRDRAFIIVFRPIFDGRYIPEVGVDYWSERSYGLTPCWMHSRPDCQPTHWIPLPTPPTAEKGRRDE